MNTRQIARYGLFLALALVFSYFETLLPVFVAVPGIKLGLANVITIIILYENGWKPALVFSVLRVLIAGVLFSGISGIVFGISGGCLSIFFMTMLKRSSRCSVLGVSMSGAVSHNLGQILTACLIIETANLMYYLPVLCISGLFTGIVTGYLSYLFLKYIRNHEI